MDAPDGGWYVFWWEDIRNFFTDAIDFLGQLIYN